MYWKDISALKKVLIQGELSQKMQFWYVLVTFVMYELFLELSTYMPSDDNTSYFDYLSSIITLLTVTLSVLFSYKANGSEGGKHFMQRFVSINFVVNFRYGLLILLPIYFLFAFVSLMIEEIYGIEFFDKSIDIITFVFIVVMELVIMFYTIKHIKDVAEKFGKE